MEEWWLMIFILENDNKLQRTTYRFDNSQSNGDFECDAQLFFWWRKV